jgi:hypothetical protein
VTTPQNFKAQLKKQIGFLQWSAEGFDVGNREEALRIGTALRVLCHDTTNSTSILHHLNALNVIMRSEAPDRNKQDATLAGRRIVGEFSWSLASISPSQSGGHFLPCIDASAPHRMIEAPAWWNETFAHVNGVDYTRKKIVLWAVNKDGGAHVDHDIPADYEQLIANGAIGSFEAPDGSIVGIEDAHHTFLRTMAFEVLHSPDLIALAL